MAYAALSPVYVSDHGHRRAHMHDIALSHEHFLGLFAYFPQQRLAEQLLVGDLLDALIEVKGRHASRASRRGGVAELLSELRAPERQETSVRG